MAPRHTPIWELQPGVPEQVRLMLVRPSTTLTSWLLLSVKCLKHVIKLLVKVKRLIVLVSHNLIIITTILIIIIIIIS